MILRDIRTGGLDLHHHDAPGCLQRGAGHFCRRYVIASFPDLISQDRHLSEHRRHSRLDSCPGRSRYNAVKSFSCHRLPLFSVREDAGLLCDRRRRHPPNAGALGFPLSLTNRAAATIMTLTSILTTNWVAYTVTAENTKATFSHHMGLHQSCSLPASSDKMTCRPFPDEDDCRDDQFFCSMWRSSGFLMSFATIVELATAISFLVVMLGGKYKREEGWRVISGLLLADAAIEFAGMGIVVSRSPSVGCAPAFVAMRANAYHNASLGLPLQQ